VKWVVEQEQAVLPCPFCGSDEVGLAANGVVRQHVWMHCGRCQATGPRVGAREPASEVEAVEQWNRRAA
jgi:Lar family restriction alleviation protein